MKPAFDKLPVRGEVAGLCDPSLESATSSRRGEHRFGIFSGGGMLPGCGVRAVVIEVEVDDKERLGTGAPKPTSGVEGLYSLSES